MGAPAKFLFDMDFSAPEKGRERAATPSEIAQQIASAEARAYRDGFDAAMREAKAESDRRAALALEEIGIALRGIATRFSGIETRMETEAVDVAVAVARKLCSELMTGEPLAEVMALVRDCFSHLVSTPHLVVRINDALYDAARERIEHLFDEGSFVELDELARHRSTASPQRGAKAQPAGRLVNDGTMPGISTSRASVFEPNDSTAGIDAIRPRV